MHVKDKQHNFDKRNSTAFGVNYDYGSVMHYSAKAFSMNGLETIQPRVIFLISL
jgi:Astacin (Peptidase family M12A)